MDLPAGLDVNESDLALFEKFVHPAFQAQRIVLVANQFGPQKLSVYAMGGLKPGKTVADLTGRATVGTGTAAATQPAATQPTGTEPTPPPAPAATRPASEFANRP